MFFGFNLNEIFLFPVKDAEARKHFLIGALVSIAALIVPIIPYFFLIGYALVIARQVLNNETPRMVAWDNWGELFKSGARVFAVRIIYSLPIIVLVIPLFVTSFALPFFLDDTSNSQTNGAFAVFMIILAATMCLLIPISMAVAIFVPAAEMHAVDKNECAAGFRIREWWAIFRSNTSGFIAAFGIYFIATMLLTLAFQIIMATLILACLMPVLLPALTMYLVLVMYVTIAQAYRDGKAKLLQNTPQST